MRFGFDRGAYLLGGGRNPHFVGFLLGDQHLDLTPAACGFGFTHSLDTLLGFHRLRAGGLGVGLRRRLLARLAVNFDRAFHAGILDRGLARDLELPQFAIAQDAGFVDAALGSDTRALHFFAGGDLGFLQRLRARHLKLLDRAPALEPGEVERLFAHHIGAAHLLGGDDIGLLHAPIRVGTLHQFGRDLDRAVLLGHLDDLAPLDIEHVARLRRFDPLALERKLGRDPRGLDRLAPLDLGVLDRFLAGDIACPRLLVGSDALGGKPLLLRDPAGLHHLAGGDLGGVDRAVARDLERTHLLVARDALAGELAILGDADRTRRPDAR